ncbi:MAG: DUF2914 domain-containing protein [candidate division Zixibacteria bacterium]|nr:DUF2914 domain-containing protein [candidate division Zixibacteria bacterium]
MLKRLCLSLLFLSLIFLPSICLNAQEKSNLEVNEILLGTGLENKEVTGVDTTFSAEVGKIYCWTKITGATSETQIAHRWYFEDKEVAKIDITVKYPSYRCWSIKSIYPEMKGNWKVNIEDSDGKLLSSISFTVK